MGLPPVRLGLFRSVPWGPHNKLIMGHPDHYLGVGWSRLITDQAVWCHPWPSILRMFMVNQGWPSGSFSVVSRIDHNQENTMPRQSTLSIMCASTRKMWRWKKQIHHFDVAANRPSLQTADQFVIARAPRPEPILIRSDVVVLFLCSWDQQMDFCRIRASTTVDLITFTHLLFKACCEFSVTIHNSLVKVITTQ